MIDDDDLGEIRERHNTYTKKLQAHNNDIRAFPYPADNRRVGLPELHSILKNLGSVRILEFIDGKVTATPGHSKCTFPSACPDLLGPEGTRSCIAILDDHPLLFHSFATNPPIAKLDILITLGAKGRTAIEVSNDTGVTIGDIRIALRRWLVSPIEPIGWY